MIRQRFGRRIIGFITALVQSLSSYLPALAGLSIITLLLTSSEQTTLFAFEQAQTDSDTEEEEDRNEESSSTNKSNDIEDDEEPEKCAIMYVRVSTSEQKRDGRSLDSQEEELSSIVERDPDMRAYTPDAIRDEGETGTNFDREGIRRVAELAHEDEPTHLLVDTVDRIGRSVAETILFIEFLRDECDVNLMTRNREFDIEKPTDKMQLTMLAAMADFGTMNRARSSLRSSADNFIKEKKWFSWYQVVPIGYEEEEDGNWIRRIDELEPVIKDIYNHFIDVESYAEVGRIITKKYRGLLEEYEIIDEAGEGEKEEDELLQGYQVKQVLKDSVYIGKPTIPATDFEHYDPYPHVEDSNLQFVSEEKFKRVEDIIVAVNEKHSTKSDLTIEPLDYAERFGPFAVDAASPTVQLLCPKCNEQLNSDGQTTVNGGMAYRYYSCPNEDCDYGRRWPKQPERDAMDMLENIEKYDFLTES